MSLLTTKVREDDWVSIEKAIRQLKKKLSPGASPTFNNLNVTNNIEITGGGQITGLTIERVADRDALEALDFYLARVAYVDSEGTLNLATTL